MQRLEAADILRVWEWGQGRHPVDQSLAILAAGFPEESFDDLARLPIGERDARLLRLREMTSGKELEGLAECPNCGTKLEFALNSSALTAIREDTSPLESHAALEIDGYAIRARLPNSFDLAAAAQAGDIESARMALLERIVESAGKENEPVRAADLPEKIVHALGERLTAMDSLADITLALECGVCGHSWQVVFDVTTFFWREIDRRARQLLVEVHILASAYGWGEAEVLSLSPARRRQYIEMVT